jgi:hypothetical protein
MSDPEYDDAETAQDRFDMRDQPGNLPSTWNIDGLLQDVDKEHTSCKWDPSKADECDPDTWHNIVCAGDEDSIGGHGFLSDLFEAPDVLQRSHEEHGSLEPAVVYGYLTTTAAFYLLRETRTLRDEQAARHEEAMEVQRQILEELRQR